MQFNDSLFLCTWLLLLRRFVQPSLVLQFERGEIPHDQIKGDVVKKKEILGKKLGWSVGFFSVFIVLLVRSRVISQFKDGTITNRKAESFC